MTIAYRVYFLRQSFIYTKNNEFGGDDPSGCIYNLFRDGVEHESALSQVGISTDLKLTRI